MAKRNSSFTEGQGGASGAESGIIKPAMERPALSGGSSTVRSQPTPVQRKVVDPDRPSVFVDPRPIDEKELATSRKRYVLSGGEVSDTPKVSRIVTTPQDRNATSKEALQKLGEHYAVMSAFANTHSGAVTTAQRVMPEAFSNHSNATKKLSSASENLSLAKTAFANKNAPQGNGHLQNAAAALVSAHSSLSHKSVREVTGTEVPIHKDELASWKDHTTNLRSFRRQGKPFESVAVGTTRVRPNSKAASEIIAGAKGTMLEEKVQRARRGTPRTPKWERDLPGRPSRTEKMSAAGSGAKVRPNRGGEAVDSTSRGTASGTTGEMDPRRKASKNTTIRTTIAKPNLPKIGDTSKKAKKPMKPGDVVEGR